VGFASGWEWMSDGQVSPRENCLPTRMIGDVGIFDHGETRVRLSARHLDSALTVAAIPSASGFAKGSQKKRVAGFARASSAERTLSARSKKPAANLPGP
jgi:hypothetical protein